MNKKELKHLSEIALIRAIPELTINEVKPSRTKSLFIKLQKACDYDLRKMKNPSKKDINNVRIIMEKFKKLSGWGKNQRHTATLISFCLGIIEKSEWRFNKRIIESLTDLILHFENGNDLPYQSAWAGDLASDKWLSLFE